MSILTINAGSSTLKFGLFDDDAGHQLASGLIDWTGDARGAELVIRPAGRPETRTRLTKTNYHDAGRKGIEAMTAAYPESPVTAVGHRVVHGGDTFRTSVRIDEDVYEAIDRYADLAPLHNPPALDGIDAARTVLPDAPQVAVFDTAFYADLPPGAYIYPAPYNWYTNWGIRRFGFHGISHAYCAQRVAGLLDREVDTLRIVSCHLGNGCSLTAVQDGTAVATTMGFTPMEGVMMGSRAGSIDPGILLHILKNGHLSVDQLDDALNHRSGLFGVSGISSDYRQLEEAAREGHERARLALDIYARQIRSGIGALAVTMGGLDALVFTAGVGENAAGLRSAVCDGLGCLGIHLDEEENNACKPDIDIAAPDSPVRIPVIHTHEERMIAREAKRVISIED